MQGMADAGDAPPPAPHFRTTPPPSTAQSESESSSSAEAKDEKGKRKAHSEESDDDKNGLERLLGRNPKSSVKLKHPARCKRMRIQSGIAASAEAIELQ